MNRIARHWLMAFSAALLVVGVAGPGEAHEDETGKSEVHDLEATASGTQVSVTGHAVFGGQHRVVVGEDPGADNLGGAATAPLGLDFTSFAISQPDAGKPELAFRIKLASMLGGGIPEGVLYNWDVTIDGGETAGGSNWSIKTMRSRASATGGSLNPWAAVNACVPNATGTGFTCSVRQTVPATFEEGESAITIRVPLAALDASPGSVIDAWPRATNPLWIGPSASGAQTLTNVFDTGTHDVYNVPKPVVQVALAPTGTPEGNVDFSKAATLGAAGNFTGALTAPGPGSYDVWAKACFADNCGTASTSVNVS